MNRQSALREVWTDSVFSTPSQRAPLMTKKSQKKGVRIPLPSPRDFFIASSDETLNDFFGRMYEMDSPEREEMFVQFCLRDNCEDGTI